MGGSFRDELRYQAERGDFGPGDVDDLIEEVVAIYRRGDAVSYEREIAGRGRTLQINVAPTPEGGYVSIITDITAQKRAEEARRESEGRYSLIPAAAPEGLDDWHLTEDEPHAPPPLPNAVTLTPPHTPRSPLHPPHAPLPPLHPPLTLTLHHIPPVPPAPPLTRVPGVRGPRDTSLATLFARPAS